LIYLNALSNQCADIAIKLGRRGVGQRDLNRTFPSLRFGSSIYKSRGSSLVCSGSRHSSQHPAASALGRRVLKAACDLEFEGTKQARSKDYRASGQDKPSHLPGKNRSSTSPESGLVGASPYGARGRRQNTRYGPDQ